MTADTARMTCARNIGSHRRVTPTVIETGSKPDRPHPTKETEVVSPWSRSPGKERDASRHRALSRDNEIRMDWGARDKMWRSAQTVHAGISKGSICKVQVGHNHPSAFIHCRVRG